MTTKSKENNKLVAPFFSHDIAARIDKSIIKLLQTYGWEGYGLFWAVVEFMHRNDFKIEEESIVAYDLRVSTEKIHSLMNDFELFKVQDGYYISDRIIKNIEYQLTKSEQNSEAAKIKWLLYEFNKEYKEIFGEAPVLNTDEIKVLKQYSKRVPDLKEKLPDILFTLKHLKFDNDINFMPCADWLLSKNNLGKLLNGEFGKLKHKKTESEIEKEQEKIAAQKAELEKPSELQIRINSICNKVDAIELINSYRQKTGTKTIIPPLKTLMKKFDIKDKELSGVNKL